MVPFCGSFCIVIAGLPCRKSSVFPFRSGWLPVHARFTIAGLVGRSHRGELPAFNDIDRFVLARLALKGALLRAGPVGFYSCEPHRRAALGARWMNDVL
jgi:hypothetical protein